MLGGSMFVVGGKRGAKRREARRVAPSTRRGEGVWGASAPQGNLFKYCSGNKHFKEVFIQNLML